MLANRLRVSVAKAALLACGAHTRVEHLGIASLRVQEQLGALSMGQQLLPPTGHVDARRVHWVCVWLQRPLGQNVRRRRRCDAADENTRRLERVLVQQDAPLARGLVEVQVRIFEKVPRRVLGIVVLFEEVTGYAAVRSPPRGRYLKVEASCVVAADHHRAVHQRPRGGIRGATLRATDDTRVQRGDCAALGTKDARIARATA